MIKKIFKTLLIVLSIFFFIVIFDIILSILTKNNCSQENPACPENYLCNFNKKSCVQAEKCPEKKPEVCITLYDPVCSNGKEYSNGCFACMEIESYYKGPC